MTIDKATIEQINASIDLVEYASQQMNLIKRGKDYFCSCPLHEDKTPSLSFNSGRNLFYCFSCGKGGGIINYLQYFEGLSFDDAVNKAIKLSNGKVELSKSNAMSFLKSIKTEDEQITHKVLDKSIYEKYNKGEVTLWQQEGILQSVMDLYEIRIDTNQNRIVYPVYDMQGNFINIKGRTMYPNYKELGIPKYINYFPVGTMDYFQGYNVAKDYIKDEVIVFEGIKSVMKAYGWGYKNCISAEKHTLTDEQVDALASMKCDVVFAYDSDVNYYSKDVLKSLLKLSKVCNVYIVADNIGWLGAKDAPVDKGKETWDFLYGSREKLR